MANIQTRKAVLRVFELSCKRHGCREMAIVATAETLCLPVEAVREVLDAQQHQPA
jgi:hypothetical protein